MCLPLYPKMKARKTACQSPLAIQFSLETLVFDIVQKAKSSALTLAGSRALKYISL